MAKKKPEDDGFTADERTEQETLEAQARADEAADAADAKAKAVKAAKPAKSVADPTAEIARLEARIVELQAEKAALEHPFIEFPKMVKGRTFQSREEQDAAGAEFAD